MAPLRQTDGTLHSSPHTKADILNCQFKSVFTKEDMSSIIVTISGVEKLLKNIKPYKGTGPDSIPCGKLFFLVNLRVVVSIQRLVCRDLVCLCACLEV
jgi:hypothetical protein